MRGALAALAVAVLVAAGCGGETNSFPTTQPPPTPPPPPPPTTAPTTTATEPTDGIALLVYFLGNGKIATSTRMVPKTTAVATAALNELLEGPDGFEQASGYTSAIPAGTTFSNLTIENGVASLKLPALLPTAAQAQIVYTLTQFSTVQSVDLGGSKAATRATYEELTPPILVEEPTPGQAISSPVRIRGTANTFEATFVVRLLLNAAGAKAFEQPVTATSGNGTRGTFDVSIPYKVSASGPGTLVAFESSAEDGSEIHRVEIPVNVTP